MKTVHTYTANIYCGLREAYDGPVLLAQELQRICQRYVDEVDLGITFTLTHFIYRDGQEPGVIVGLINYPRFPSTPDSIDFHAKVLATKLMRIAKQQRVTIVTPGQTYMLEREVDVL